MLEEFKATLVRKVGAILDYMPSRRYELLQWQLDDIQAMAHLQALTPLGVYIPFTSWSMRPTAIVHLLNEILIQGRRNIVEFGPGASTIYMAKLIAAHDLPATLTCVESDPNWIGVLSNILQGQGLGHVVRFLQVPIAPSPYMQGTSWYDVEQLSSFEFYEVDMVVVDGPPGGSGSFSRYGAIPFLRPFLQEQATVFLDDTHRSEEKEIIERWKAQLPQNFMRFRKYTMTRRRGFDSRPLSAAYQTLLSYI